MGRRPDEHCRNDGAAARQATGDALLEDMRLRDNDNPVPLPISFLATLAPYFCDLPENQLRSLQLTPELVAELTDAEPGLESIRRSREELREMTSIYIDVPAGTVVLGEAVDLRAIFIEPWVLDRDEPLADGTETESLLSFCAVLTPRGRYGWRHIIWRLDDHGAAKADNYTDIPEMDGMPPFDELLEVAGVTEADLLDDLERLAFLVLDRSRNRAAAPVRAIPHMPADHPRRRPRHGHNVAKRFSLFKVDRLMPVPRERNHNARDPGEDAPRWQLGRRISVKGYHRWQRVGKRSEGRVQRIWVREHRKGPLDGLPLHLLTRPMPVSRRDDVIPGR